MGELRNKAQNGGLRHCQFRSLCWRYFLNCLPGQYEQWIDTCKARRESYETIRTKHLSAIKPTKVVNSPESNKTTELESSETNRQLVSSNNDNENPSTNDNETKSKIELDEEKQFTKASGECDHKNVFRTIERDVVRTFPDMEFFKQTDMQNILENVLFNFASENPHISYKQGMHELLATLLYVAHTDSQNCLINYEGDYANETIATLLDLEYLEHDVFHLFSALMRSLETWYQNDEILVMPEKPSLDVNNYMTRSSTSNKQQVNSVLGLKLKKISENILKYHDLELFNHLEALQIAPQIYGIRWMRLLFGREFEFLDLLMVWDAIICDANPMSLMEYVFASMLITMREELVNGDYTDCLNNLMRYQYKDVPHVIKLALYLRDPINNSRPRPHSQVAPRSHKQSSSSLTSKLSQQYISDRQFLQQQASSNKYHSHHLASNPRRQTIQQSNFDDRDSTRKVFSMTSQPIGQVKQGFTFNRGDSISNVASDGIRFLAQTSRNTAAGAFAGSRAKLLPNINRFVSSIGQNIQDKASPHMQFNPSSSRSPTGGHGSRMAPQQLPSSSSNSSQMKHGQKQYQQRPSDLILSPNNTVKEYEMREMQSTSASGSSSSAPTATADGRSRFPMGKPGAGSSDSPSRNAFNISTESYDDLHSIVDYCWRLLSEQIDSLQRCLPKEKGLSSEDEIFVALAQLKKVRDVLKGSLRLEDELETNQAPGGGGK